MWMKVACPICGEARELPAESPVGTRRLCRRCGTVLELRELQPLEVVKVPACAEDFGI